MHTYLFDFDGTLVDSMPVFASAVLRILDENNIPYESDIVKTVTPLGYAGTAELFLTMGVQSTVEELIQLMKEYMKDAYFNSIDAKSNVIFALNELKSQGASLNILTASPHLVLDACLKRLGIYDLFTNVWSCEDFSMTKSDIALYRSAAARLGVPVNEVLFLDDNFYSNKTAKEAGMMTCGVFDESSREFKEELQSLTDYYIQDFLELLAI